MKVSDVFEAVMPASADTLRQRLDQARQQAGQAQAALDAAQAAYSVALAGDDDKVTAAAQAAVSAAQATLERAVGRMQAYERRVQAAAADERAKALEADKRRLAGLVADRQAAGEKLIALLDQAQATVETMDKLDAEIHVNPARSRDAVAGLSYGRDPLRKHIAIELRLRDLHGERSSLDGPALREWIESLPL